MCFAHLVVCLTGKSGNLTNRFFIIIQTLIIINFYKLDVFSHGAGGLAGQHRLGARHGASVVFLGICKIMIAIFLGKSALALFDAFPKSVLGIMLAIGK